MAQRPSTTAKRKADTAERILEEALALAEEVGWGKVRLRQVAERMDVPLAAVLEHYRDLDGVADAWFAKGWQAMLQPPPDDFTEMPPPDRLHLILMRWFDALEPHRRVTGEMISEKLWYAHPHHWVPAIFNLSRTILWLREAALLDAPGRQRQIEEIGLTTLFLATLRAWLRDDTEGQEKTRTFLRNRLAAADRIMALAVVRRRRHQPPEPPENQPPADQPTATA